MSLSNDLDFLYEIGALRRIQRTWSQFLGKDVANVSEHIFRVIWIALIIAKNEKVENTEKIIKMALVHDISESRTGDTHYVSRLYVKRFEEDSIEATMENISIKEEFLTLWKESETRETIESRIVKDADNLDVDIELMEITYTGNEVAKTFKQRRLNIREKFYTETAKKLFDLTVNSNPHTWHLNANNRFNSKDFDDKK